MGTHIYRAPFVVTGTGPIIEDGAVLVSDNRIVAVDRFGHLRNEPAEVIDCEGHILAPALINCHAHLELSWMAGLGSDADHASGDITSWIASLLKKRDSASPTDEVIMTAARHGLAQLHATGTILVADIGNRGDSVEIGRGHSAEVLFFLEMMGLTQSAAQQNFERLAALSSSVTAHGPYSVHPELIQALKKRALARGDLFPVHSAESLDEIEFLETGKGRFYDFLNARLKTIGEFDTQELADVYTVPGCRAIAYLDSLGVLDENTLCVHCVHVDEAEVELLALRNAKVCLCPQSNRHIGVGAAPLELFLEKGILPGLGTDSLASNKALNLFTEMSALAEDHPLVDPGLIFATATIGGAKALHKSEQFGSLAKGKNAAIIAVEFEDSCPDDIYSFLVHAGDAVRVKWLESFHG